MVVLIVYDNTTEESVHFIKTSYNVTTHLCGSNKTLQYFHMAQLVAVDRTLTLWRLFQTLSQQTWATTEHGHYTGKFRGNPHLGTYKPLCLPIIDMAVGMLTFSSQ